MEDSTVASSAQRVKFLTQLNWYEYLATPGIDARSIFNLRIQIYKEIEALRGRPLIVYASNFLSGNAHPDGSIVLDDVTGFTDLISNIPSEIKEVDVLIHSPGGRPDATERIVSILRNRFEKVHFLVPHSAYSAATMLALSGDSITLHPSATLGPIDPQLMGIPARSIIRGFENVKEAIKREGPEALPAYIPLIEKYTLDQLEQCNDAADLSRELVATWIKQYMFHGEGDDMLIEEAVKYFSNYDEHKLHSRPLLFEKIKGFGLAVEQSSGELTQLLWESYLVINGFFEVMAFYKLYENSFGLSFGKQFNVIPNNPPQVQQNHFPVAHEGI